MDDAAARRIAVVVDPGVPLGVLANAVGVVAAGLGAALPALAGEPLQDAAGRRFMASARVPMPVLQATPSALMKLMDAAATAEGLDALVVFPCFAREIHDFATYRATLATRDLADEPLAAVGLAGRADVVKALTRRHSLLRA